MVGLLPEGRVELPATVQTLANAIPLIGVVGFGWQAVDLLELYWLEVGMIAVVYSVLFSAQVPTSPERTHRETLLVRGGSFVMSIVALGVILLLERSLLFGFVHGSPGDVFAAVQRLAVAVLGMGVSYTVWLLSIYFPERSFADGGFGRVANQLWRELLLLHALAIVVALVGPLVGSALGVLVLVVVVKLYVGVTFGHTIQLFGSDPPTDDTGARND